VRGCQGWAVEGQSTFRPGFMFPSVGRKFQNPNETLHHAFSTPTAALALGQPTSLSLLTVRFSLASLILYSWERTTDTTSASLRDEQHYH